jgi:hypothetical protein
MNLAPWLSVAIAVSLAACATARPPADDLHVLSRNGPLPVHTEFTSPGGRRLLLVTGSAWSAEEGTGLVVEVVLDGSIVATGRLFSNGPDEHRTLVFPATPLTLATGSHVVELRRGNELTASDGYDYYEVTLAGR